VADVLLRASSIYPRTGPGASETRRFRHRQAGDRRRYLPLVMELASRATAHYGAHHTAGRQQPAGGRHFGEAAPPTSPSPTAPPGVPAHLRDLWRRVWCASPPVRPDRIRAPPAATGGRKDQPRVSACDDSVSMRGVRTGPQLQCPAERRYLATSSRSAGRVQVCTVRVAPLCNPPTALGSRSVALARLLILRASRRGWRARVVRSVRE